MNCIIIDDDPLFQEVLSQYLKKENITPLAKFERAFPVIEFIKKNTVDLIFLDLQMPEITGPEFLKLLHPKLPCIILTTSDPSFALEAFQYNVSGYLIKPFSYPKFKMSFDKVQSSLQLTELKEENDHLFVKKGTAHHRVDKSDIIYLECNGDYANIITSKEKYILHGSMKELERIFSEPEFIRVHRSFIVRKNQIRLIKDESITIQEKSIPIGKTYRQEVFKKLKI